MTDSKKKNLEESYERIINVGLCIVPYEDLSDIAAPEVMLFGTTKDEKLFSFRELDAMFKSQYEQMDGFVPSLDRKRLFTRTSYDGNNAIITEEVILTITSPEEVNTIFIRCSCIMEYIDNQWKLTHWHASTPVDTENDHWHMEEWKREKEKLQKLVDQQTADLHGKNRELKIEAALERIRAQATAMQESSDLLDIVVTMRTEFVNLGHEAHYFWHMRWLPEKYEKAMTSGDGKRIGMVMTLPRHIHGDIEPVAEWEKRNEPTYVLAMDVETAVEYVNKMISLGDFEQLDPQAPTLDDIRHIGGLTFIMARTTHGEIGYSLPGVVPKPPKEAVDTLVRFAGVFDLAYRRFEDLKKAEAQARETQIELALERVRARTMAMQKSEELAEVAFVLFEQLRELGGNLWGTGFGLCEKNSDKDSFWFANENGVFPPVSIPNTTDPAHKQMFEGWKAGEEYMAIQASGKELENHYDYMMTLPEVRPFFQKILDEGLSFPKWQQWNAAYFSHGYLLIITLEPYPDPDILVRFAGVFDQTYTRFLDLKNAEAQAKEANIQLALERVRAKTMAMKTQGDLLGIIELFGEQLNAVDVRFDDVTIIDGPITKNRDWELWSFVPEAENLSHKILIPYIDTPYFTKTAEAVEEYEKTGNSVQVKTFTKKEKDEFIDHYRKYAPEVVDEVSDLVYANPGSVIVDAFLEEVTISLVRWDLELYTDEELEIFERFAKEFRRTYIRFLDLQKSEEQAREAKIEAALERVRARSMGMHKSDDLIDVVREIGKGIHELGIQLHYSQIYTDYTYDPKTGLNIWVDVEGRDYLEKFHLPYIDHSITLNFLNALNEGLDYFSDRYSKAEKDSYFKLLFKYSDLKRIPKKRKELILNASGWTRFTVILNEATLNFGRYTLDEFTDEEHEIFIRFAKVFGQAYTRFLDLKKAEEQAKEAQVEAALERVRSRSLAMHKTEELQNVVRVVAEELKNTGVILDTGGAVICTYFQDSKDVIHWTATEDPSHPSVPYLLPYFEDELFDEAWESKKRGDEYFAKEFSFEVKNNFWKNAFEHSDYRQLPDEYKKIILESKSHGLAWAWAENSAIMIPSIQGDLPSEEEKKTLIRFAKVFEQSFIRFLDLQKAEAQAREAQIEAALEKVRSRTMGMQSSDELPEVANMLFLEVQALGIPAWSSGFNILAEDKKSAAAWMSSEGTLQDPFTLRLYGEASFDEMGDFLLRDEPFMVQELGGEALQEHYKHMKSFPDLKPTFDNIEEKGLSLPTYQINHLCKFSHGFLLFITYEPVPDAHDIFKRFTNVFDQTYTRFLDLKKSEKRAREAEVDLSLERVRSQVTAMQTSSDLFDIVVNMRKEFISLGHTADYFWHMSWQPDSYEMSMTSEDGNRIGMVISLPKFVHEKIPGLNEWEKGSEPIYVLALAADEAWKYIENMNTHGQYKHVDPNAPSREDIEHIGGLTFVIARTSHGEIGFSLQGEVPNPSKEALDTLVRFAGVFDLAYQRFEDLQDSEQQARLIREERDRLEIALNELHATQDQLVQQEKLASLGQLTAGIAHEIKNPLNFVNNFSDLSVELVQEAREEVNLLRHQLRQGYVDQEGFGGQERQKESPLEGGKNDEVVQGDAHGGNHELLLEILDDIEINLKTIHKHGSRADGIVKSMLQHSRGGDGTMEPTPLNPIIKEYVNLAFHGMRAGKDPINVDIDLQLDENVGEVPLVAEDFSRVILNLCNNAFDAMREKLSENAKGKSAKSPLEGGKDGEAVQGDDSSGEYVPKLTVRTLQKGDSVTIEIEDNGLGIPDEMKDKILQPFFTTKKGTAGTGLGLSITNDIVKAHGGSIDIHSQPGKTIFTINLTT